MQEELNFIQIPKIDTSRLSSVEEFMVIVDRFKQKYNIELEFNENARWRPGSYERLKAQVTNSLFDHWSKPKGANTIRRLVRFNRYNLEQCANRMIEIDDKLKLFRQNKQTLNREQAAAEGKESLDYMMSQLTKKYDNIEINILPTPFYSSTRRSIDNNHSHNQYNNGELWEPNWDEPLLPTIDETGLCKKDNFIISKNERFNTLTSGIQETLKLYSENTNPKRWFVNITVTIEDINIDYSRNDVNQVTLPFGDMVVSFTMSIYDLILNYRKILSIDKDVSASHLENLLNLRYYSNHTHIFPYVDGILHPFISREGNERYNTYQNGNTCFGNFRQDVMIALSTANMPHLRALLNIWARTYHLGNTSPLNQPESHHIGMPVDWNDNIRQSIATDVRTCKRVIDRGYHISQFIADFCNQCALRKMECDFYKEISFVPTPLTDEFKDTLKEYLLEEYLHHEVDSLFVINGQSFLNQDEETVNKLYLIMIHLAQQMWNSATRAMIKKILGLEHQELNGCFEVARVDFLDRQRREWQSRRNEIKENSAIIESKGYPFNELLQIYLYAERIYVLDGIYTYNNEVAHRFQSEYSFNNVVEAEESFPIDEMYDILNSHKLIAQSPGIWPKYHDFLINKFNLD